MKLDLIKKFVLKHDFPCIMAQKVARKRRIVTHQTEDLSLNSVPEILRQMNGFISCFRSEPSKLASFILICKDPRCTTFEDFESMFWPFLRDMNSLDKKQFDHDPRVKSDPADPKFSFSIGGEAFFIIALHPLSPRRARRFPYPAIVFNAHVQFENLRKKGIFTKIRNVIRRRDRQIQSENPMLKDFGNKSEIFQYLGRVYSDSDPLPLQF